ncbi:hypothetical protein LUZ60_009231 [Juncus effusus]|nr:hypothetical protein LUZ60_009231 [Juncus effusus]
MSLSRDLRDYKELKGNMMLEGVISEAFLTLEGVQDEADPQFAFDMIDLFISDAESILREVNNAVRDLRQLNLVLADAQVHQLKGSTSCVGVKRIRTLTEAFRTCYLQGSVDGCLRIIKELNQEFVFCKNRLLYLKNLGMQIKAAGGVLP